MNSKRNFDNNVLSKKLKNYFKENIKFSLKTEDEVFVVTENDIFYEINIYDENIHFFISNNDYSIIDKMIVKELCNKKIIDLIHNKYQVYAKTEDDKIYGWGFINKFDPNFNYDFENFNKPKLIEPLSYLNINSIKCGKFHLFALTKNSEVYIWGWSGFFFRNFDSSPVKINFFEDETIMISCGLFHTLLLTKKGRVYILGHTGKEEYENFDTPKLIEFGDVSIRKISCGQRHSLMLSNDGVIYTIGKAYLGKLWLVSEKDKLRPTKLRYKKKFVDIATHWNEYISAALSIDNILYVWDVYEHEHYFNPIETTFKSFNEIFINYCEHDLEISKNLSEFSDLSYRHEYYKRNYIELHKIGEGGYGKVFKVIEAISQVEYAIKKITFNKEHKNEILREVYRFSLIHKLLNPNIVSHDKIWIENSIKDEKIILYFQMDLCDKTLKQITDEIRNDSIFRKDNILTPIAYFLLSQIFIEILESVQFLHENHIIHRDLNPYNIMLNIDLFIRSFIRIVDFGLIAIHEFADQSHSSNKGNIEYIAPEVFDGRIYDTKADIYSLGILLCHLFDIDIKKNFKENRLIPDIMKSKYNKLIEIYNKMIDEDPDKRPNCKEILEEKYLWALYESEFEFDFPNIYESEIKYEIQFIYFILKHKLNYHLFNNMEDVKKGRISHIFDILNNYKHRPTIVEFNLFCLYDFLRPYWVSSNDLIELIVILMRKHSKIAKIQLNAIKCLYELTKKEPTGEISSETLGKAVDVTLLCIDSFPNQIEIHLSAIFFLCNWHIMESITFDKYKCIELVMNSLINFKDIHINQRALIIISKLFQEISNTQKLILCTNSVYVQTLLEIMNYIESNPTDECKLVTTVNTLFFLTFQLLNKLDSRVVENMIHIILKLMECFSNNQVIQTQCLLILKDIHILQKVSFDRYKCIELILNSTVNFKDTFLNEESLFICSVLVQKISIPKKTKLFSNPVYLDLLLDTIKNHLNEETKKYCLKLLIEIGTKAFENNYESSKTQNDNYLMCISKQILDIIEENTTIISHVWNSCAIM